MSQDIKQVLECTLHGISSFNFKPFDLEIQSKACLLYTSKVGQTSAHLPHVRHRDRSVTIPASVKVNAPVGHTSTPVSYTHLVEEVVSSSISFQVMGNVERVLVGEGQKVREGQLLAVLDKATLENAYNASAASLRQAEDAYARMRTLHENKSLPDMKWVEVESKLEQARSMERILSLIHISFPVPVTQR